MTDLLNAREWAILLWASAFLIWAGRHEGVRASLWGVLKSLSHPKIAIWILIGAAYTIVVVMALHLGGIWTSAQTKDTVVWFVFTGITTAFSLIGSWKGESLSKIFAKDALKITIVLEFLADEYTMPLAAELVLVPFLVTLGGMTAIADHYPEYARVKPTLTWAQALAGTLILAVALHGAVSDWQHLQSLDALRKLALAPLLSMLFIPFGYAVLLFTTYENTLLRLRFALERDPDMLRYARRQLVGRFGLNVRGLHSWSQVAIQQLCGVRSRAELDQVLTSSAEALRLYQDGEL